MSMKIQIAVLSLVAASQVALATERHVPSEYGTIAAAVSAASSGDEIIVAPGIYTDDAGGALIRPMGKAITIRSSDGPVVTILNGGGSKLGIVCDNGESASTIIDGFTVTSCSPAAWTVSASPVLRNLHLTNSSEASYAGGAIFSGGSPTLESSSITDCMGLLAGGLCVFSGELHLTACTIQDCTGEWGGASYVGPSSTIMMDACSFLDNTATGVFGGGGASYIDSNAWVDMVACDAQNNVANYGGAVLGNGGWISSTGSLFEGNTAGYGGAIYTTRSFSSSFDVFRGNIAGVGGNGGAVWISAGGTIDQGEFDDNQAGSNGGAIFVQSTSVTIQDTWFNANTPNDVAGPWSDGGGVEAATTCGVDVTGDQQVDVADVVALLATFGQRCAGCRYDIDGDGTVTVRDLLAMLESWSAC